MLAYISGPIVEMSPTAVVIDHNGLGLRCQISVHTFSRINGQKQCHLFIHMHFKNEGQSLSAIDLYGFSDKEELELFEMLISVSGIGANTGRMMFSSLSPNELRTAIVSGDEATIKGIKGIGPKTAKRVILELRDKLADGRKIEEIPMSAGNTPRTEALEALLSLGFPKATAEKALNRTMQHSKPEDLSVEDLIKQTLKSL